MDITWNDTDTVFIISMAVTSSNASSIDVTIAWNNNTSIFVMDIVLSSVVTCNDNIAISIVDVEGEI